MDNHVLVKGGFIASKKEGKINMAASTMLSLSLHSRYTVDIQSIKYCTVNLL